MFMDWWGKRRQNLWQRMMNARGERRSQSECSISKIEEIHGKEFLSAEAKKNAKLDSGCHEENWYGLIYVFVWNLTANPPLCSLSQCLLLWRSLSPYLFSSVISSLFRTDCTSSFKYCNVSFNNIFSSALSLPSLMALFLSYFFSSKLVEFIVFTSSFPIHSSICFPDPPKSITNMSLAPVNIFKPPPCLLFPQNLTLLPFCGFPDITLSWFSSYLCSCFNILCRVIYFYLSLRY